MAEEITRPSKKLYEREWLEVVSLARNGTSIAKIAEIYDVHHTVLYRGLRKRGIKVGNLLAEAKEEETDRHREQLIQRITDTKEKDYKFTEFLQQQVVKVVSDAVKPTGRGAGAVLDDIKCLKIAIDAVKNATDNKWRILGLDKENQDADAALPELPIREMTSHEVDAIRNRQELEDGNLTPDQLAEAMSVTSGMDEMIDDAIVDDNAEDEPAF